jgi:hypothetical protein
MISPVIEARWRQYTLSAFNLVLDVFDGPDPSENMAGGITSLLQQNGPVRLGVWVGPGMDLVGWRARLATSSAQFGPVERITICGQTAERQEARTQPSAAVGLFRSPTGMLGHLYEAPPPAVEVASAFELHGQMILLGWTVEVSQRQTWRAAEEHFFASVRCP